MLWLLGFGYRMEQGARLEGGGAGYGQHCKWLWQTATMETPAFDESELHVGKRKKARREWRHNDLPR